MSEVRALIDHRRRKVHVWRRDIVASNRCTYRSLVEFVLQKSFVGTVTRPRRPVAARFVERLLCCVMSGRDVVSWALAHLITKAWQVRNWRAARRTAAKPLGQLEAARKP